MMQISVDAGNTVTVGASVAMAAVRSLVFIDPGIDQWQGLVAKLRGAPRLVLLDPDQDGVWQISQVLAGCHDLVAVHILAHGVPGCLRLGSTNLSLATLYRHAEQVAGWRAALGSRAEILIFDDEVAVGAEGEALLRRLRDLTGAELTASTTPPPRRGGCPNGAKGARKTTPGAGPEATAASGYQEGSFQVGLMTTLYR